MRRTNWAMIGITALLGLTGCDEILGTGKDMAGGGVVDMATTPPDFAGADLAGVDLVQAQDLAMEPDLAGEKTILLQWQLINKNIVGGVGNGFPTSCGEAGVTEFEFTITNINTKASRVSKIKCEPKDNKIGEGTGVLPDAMGPYEICATAVGKPSSRSDKVGPVMPNSNVSVRIYYEGCDQANCCQ